MSLRRRIPVWTIAGLIGSGLLPAPASGAIPETGPETARSPEAPLPARQAVREGNRRFRRGDPAGAVEAYRRAGDETLRSDPVLAYNLATALHRIDRLPEAVLWYRRARRHQGNDLWVSENLERARAALAAPRPGPPPAVAPFLLHPRVLPTLGAVVAWWALALVAWPRRRRSAGAVTGRPGGRLVPWLLATAALLWGAQLGLDRLGPRPAVLMEPCGRALPAGSEVWVSPAGGDPAAWIVHGREGGARCPAEAVATL